MFFSPSRRLAPQPHLSRRSCAAEHRRHRRTKTVLAHRFPKQAGPRKDADGKPDRSGGVEASATDSIKQGSVDEFDPLTKIFQATENGQAIAKKRGSPPLGCSGGALQAFVVFLFSSNTDPVHKDETFLQRKIEKTAEENNAQRSLKLFSPLPTFFLFSDAL